MGPRVTRLLLRLIPERDREAVEGDLLEAGPPPGVRRLVALVGIALHAQLEPWRDSRTRLGAASLWLVALALLWSIPAAAGAGTPDPTVYSGLLLAFATLLWAHAHLAAAVAAGLVLGHGPGVPSWADGTRGHGALLLALPAATLAPGLLHGLVTVAVLWGAAWFGARARRLPVA